MTGGSAVIPVNNNRNVTNPSGVVLTAGVTVATTLGTKISSAKWGSKQLGGGHKREDEMILKQGTTYLREFISSTNSNIVSFQANWYEHISKV